MRNLKKSISVILCAAFAAGILNGCGNVDREKYVARTRSEAESSSQDENNNNSQNSPDEKITSDGAWTSMAFNIDGNDLVMSHMPYSSLEAAGWSFNASTYGMENLSSDPGVFYQRSVYLEHDGYDDGTTLVGFANFGSEVCGLDSIQLWSIEFLTKDKTNYPVITLEGGITWGSDENAVKTAYGEPSATERNDTEGYTEFIYTDNAGKTIYLDLYDGTGVGRIILESYV